MDSLGGSVDLKNKTITIDKSLEYRNSRGTWEAGAPKTTASYRTIPLTSKAYNILTRLYDARKNRYEAPELYTQLEFKDKLTGEIRYLNMKDLVFINRKGMPTKNSSYDTHLYNYVMKLVLSIFLCMFCVILTQREQ